MAREYKADIRDRGAKSESLYNDIASQLATIKVEQQNREKQILVQVDNANKEKADMQSQLVTQQQAWQPPAASYQPQVQPTQQPVTQQQSWQPPATTVQQPTAQNPIADLDLDDLF